MASRANSWRSYRPGAAVGAAPAIGLARRATVRVLGLDPGSQTTGFGVIESGPQGARYLASGAIRARAAGPGAAAFARRLQDIYAGVAAVIAEHGPTEIAVERVFVHRNPDSALKLGQARGAALCATFASGAAVHEYTPREVKLAVVGFGAAEKEQVQRMVRTLLGLSGRLGADAADALAIALCHAHGRGARSALAPLATGGRTMIGYLRGRLAARHPPALVVDVAGVGYECEAPMSTFYVLPQTGMDVLLHTHLVVREDAQLLYAFATEQERRLFRSLLKVSGVGPRIALGLLSGIDVDGFLLCVEAQDADPLVRIPGVGRKTAERLLIELRDRVKDITSAAGTPSAASGGAGGSPAQQEAYGALVALGYRPAEVAKLLKAVAAEGATTEDLIRGALRSVAG